ncbi:two component transcriptional regulator, LytTR family [Chishuiella changwenlii]|uniref:DNA-binding response regulator n=1 Tax=Chishuiella changwenlii TaxID=1434701 RepID=A0A1M6ZWZ3_9FLAO|nr:LytTR family DNA-binding domain-containing protein [Chishuiella changwenlii]GGE92336.1 DNA-binding response regulator [Chishuiella changwenlii]SHL34865.1 two component transcriptional regulator, LytTR family [Chishuiella changwenlii]
MDKKLKCLIIDDEIAAHYVLVDYIAKLPYLELSGECFNAIDAIVFLHQNPIDLIFLDINMPDLSGLEFLKTLQNPPKVILTTAYKDYAIEGFELGVSDYLLKPIAFQRFAKATERVYNVVYSALNIVKNSESQYIFIKVERDNIKIMVEDIFYIQSEGNFSKIFLKDKFLLTSTTTSELENKLPHHLFMRIHKSYIVGLKKIERFDTKSVTVNNVYIPIGITYRREFAERVE